MLFSQRVTLLGAVMTVIACSPRAPTGAVPFPNPGLGLPYFVGKDFELTWERPVTPRQVMTFQLVDQRGQTITEIDMDRHWSLANFFFTTCTGICSPLMKRLKEKEALLRKKDPSLVIYSHSVTPETDHPARLRQFATSLGLPQAKWRLLTGDREKILRLAREIYGADTKTPSNPTEKEFVHSESIYLLDPERRIRGIYNGMSANSLDQLVSDFDLKDHQRSES